MIHDQMNEVVSDCSRPRRQARHDAEFAESDTLAFVHVLYSAVGTLLPQSRRCSSTSSLADEPDAPPASSRWCASAAGAMATTFEVAIPVGTHPDPVAAADRRPRPDRRPRRPDDRLPRPHRSVAAERHRRRAAGRRRTAAVRPVRALRRLDARDRRGVRHRHRGARSRRGASSAARAACRRREERIAAMAAHRLPARHPRPRSGPSVKFRVRGAGNQPRRGRQGLRPRPRRASAARRVGRRAPRFCTAAAAACTPSAHPPGEPRGWPVRLQAPDRAGPIARHGLPARPRAGHVGGHVPVLRV